MRIGSCGDGERWATRAGMSTGKASLVLVMALAGCTRWATSEVVGPPQEAGRRLVGSPVIEEVSQTGVDISGRGTARDGVVTSSVTGNVSGGVTTVKRTHCVQAAEVDYVQYIDYTSHIERRTADVVLSLVVAGVGALLIIDTAVGLQGNSSSDPDRMASSLTDTQSYALGGGLILAGGAWLGYSLTQLPKGPAPVQPRAEKRWTTKTYVEATGCGLPGEQSPTVP